MVFEGSFVVRVDEALEDQGRGEALGLVGSEFDHRGLSLQSQFLCNAYKFDYFKHVGKTEMISLMKFLENLLIFGLEKFLEFF